MRQVRQIALKSLYEAETSEHSALDAFERQLSEAIKHDAGVGKPRPGAATRYSSPRNMVECSRSSWVLPCCRAPTNLRQIRSGSPSLKP